MNLSFECEDNFCVMTRGAPDLPYERDVGQKAGFRAQMAEVLE
jgi:hypothetical protein